MERAADPRAARRCWPPRAGIVALLAWAWWPSGQYQPVRASDNGTLLGAVHLVSSPASAARPAVRRSRRPSLTPGRHLAVAMIPVGGATKEHPAFFIIKGQKGQPSAVIVSDSASATGGATALVDTWRPLASAGRVHESSAATASRVPAAAFSGNARRPGRPPAGATARRPARRSTATTFPFKLPSKPGPHDSQALATNDTDGGIKYDVVYSMVTVQDGATVDETNSAYALASCKACTTVAVSFQLVLIVGQTKTITPINIAEALNVNCPSCVTTAIADQIVVTIKAQPSQELSMRLNAALRKLDGIASLRSGWFAERDRRTGAGSARGDRA